MEENSNKRISGLGRGLDALFSDSQILNDINNDIYEDEKNAENIQYIKLVDIEPNPNQARKNFNEQALEELANSIKNYGILQPIIVENKGGYYQIIAGERRWRASKKAGLTEIPCIIRNEDEQKNKEISLIENIQRENLNPIEKAIGYKELIDNYNLTQQELADKLGISRPYVANTLRILNLDERILKMAKEGLLTEGHCRSLLAIPDREKQYNMALKIVNEGNTTVRDIEEIAKKEKNPKKRDEKFEAVCRDVEEKFENYFGTKVKLNAGAKSGKIIIKYSSNEELERILELIRKEN